MDVDVIVELGPRDKPLSTIITGKLGVRVVMLHVIVEPVLGLYHLAADLTLK